MVDLNSPHMGHQSIKEGYSHTLTLIHSAYLLIFGQWEETGEPRELSLQRQ